MQKNVLQLDVGGYKFTTTTDTLRNFPISDVIQKQHSDLELEALLKYIESETLPESQKLTRQILLKQFDYALISGMLVHTRHTKSKRSNTN